MTKLKRRFPPQELIHIAQAIADDDEARIPPRMIRWLLNKMMNFALNARFNAERLHEQAKHYGSFDGCFEFECVFFKGEAREWGESHVRAAIKYSTGIIGLPDDLFTTESPPPLTGGVISLPKTTDTQLSKQE